MVVTLIQRIEVSLSKFSIKEEKSLMLLSTRSAEKIIFSEKKGYNYSSLSFPMPLVINTVSYKHEHIPLASAFIVDRTSSIVMLVTPDSTITHISTNPPSSMDSVDGKILKDISNNRK